MKYYWGDLHCHCAVSYGKGTPQRALDNARRHLDFCSLTGHAFWPDMPMDLETQNPIIDMHLGGFAKLQYYWKDLLAQLDHANRNGRFVTLPSYEWHSREFGDYNCYFDRPHVPLIDAPSVQALARKLQRRPARFVMIPHHCGYCQGYRGLNWQAFNPEISPVVEIYSNHGAGEADDAPYEYHHSMGPRVGESLIRQGLLLGHRFGFIAATDNHDGYPGHYSHGRAGLWAARLDRPSLFQALRERRTIATTGARITAQMTLASAGIGQVTPARQTLPLEITLNGTSGFDKVELIEASGSHWRVTRLPVPPIESAFQPGRYQLKVETGWGRGDSRTDWTVQAKIKNGRLLNCVPYFRYSVYEPGEKTACDRILNVAKTTADWQCRSLPHPAGLLGGTHFHAGGTQSVVLEVEAGPSTRLELTVNNQKLTASFRTLCRHSVGRQIAGFGSAAFKLHRAVPQSEFQYHFHQNYQPPGKPPGFVYLRATQYDGQVAWLSPIWYE